MKPASMRNWNADQAMAIDNAAKRASVTRRRANNARSSRPVTMPEFRTLRPLWRASVRLKLLPRPDYPVRRQAPDPEFADQQEPSVCKRQCARHTGPVRQALKRSAPSAIAALQQHAIQPGDNDLLRPHAQDARQRRLRAGWNARPVRSAVVGSVHAAPETCKDHRAGIKRDRAKPGPGIGRLKRLPTRPAVIRTVGNPRLGASIEDSRCRRDRVHVIVVFADRAGYPGLASVVGREQIAVGTCGQPVLRVEKQDVEERALFFRCVVNALPGIAAIDGTQDDRVVPDRPTESCVMHVDRGEHRPGGRRGQSPAFGLVVGDKNVAAASNDNQPIVDTRSVKKQGSCCMRGGHGRPAGTLRRPRTAKRKHCGDKARGGPNGLQDGHRPTFRCFYRRPSRLSADTVKSLDLILASMAHIGNSLSRPRARYRLACRSWCTSSVGQTSGFS